MMMILCRNSKWIAIISMCLISAIFIVRNIDLISLQVKARRKSNSSSAVLPVEDDQVPEMWESQNSSSDSMFSINSLNVEMRLEIEGLKDVRISQLLTSSPATSSTYNTTLTIDNYSTAFTIATKFGNNENIKSLYKSILQSSHPAHPDFFIRACYSKSSSSSPAINYEIPHVIHQTWKTHNIPSKFSSWSSTWTSHHPDWEYRIWSDDDNLELVNTSYPWFLETYLNLPKAIMRSDAVRYCYMHRFGGFYVDLDVECLADHSPLARCGGVLLPLLGKDYRNPHNVPNAWVR